MVKRRISNLIESIYWLALLLFLFYISLIFLSPLFIQSDNRLLLGIGAGTYIFNIVMCHQLPERSLMVFGQYMSICSRDVGVFLGTTLALLLSLANLKLPNFLKLKYFALLSIVPIGIDGTAQLIGLWEGTNLSRITTGLLAGFGVIYFVVFVFLGQPKIRVRIIKKSLLIFLVFLLLFLVLTFYIGNNYKTENEILLKVKTMDNTSYIETFYLAPNAFSTTIKYDAYLSSYNDVILKDILGLNTSSHRFGAWTVVMLEEKPLKEGRYVFIPYGKGRYYYYDAMTGELIDKITR
jgi:uncharacterized membrane protein